MEILVLQLVSCGFMTGLIWTIQRVHYPAFDVVGPEQFPKFHADHVRAITWVVAPVMLVELVTALALLFVFPGSRLLWMNALLVALIWLFTFLSSVPLHNALERGQNHEVIRRLVSTNWARTFLWTFRLGLLIFVFLEFFEAKP